MPRTAVSERCFDVNLECSFSISLSAEWTDTVFLDEEEGDGPGTAVPAEGVLVVDAEGICIQNTECSRPM